MASLQESQKLQDNQNANVDSDKSLSNLLSSQCTLTNELEHSTIHLEKLRHLVQTLLSNPISDQNKKDILSFIEERFIQPEWKLLFVGILVCPWYGLVDHEQATENCQAVCVYHGNDVDMYNEEADVKGILTHQNILIMEISHFVKRFLKGLVLETEVLFLDDAMIIKATQDWQLLLSSMRNALKEDSCLGSILPFHFIKRCQAQSLNLITKKMKNDSYQLIEPINLKTFCHSLRLSAHLECLAGRSLILSQNDLNAFLTSCVFAKDCLDAVKKLQQNHFQGPCTEDLLQSLLRWNSELKLKIKEQYEKNSILWLQQWVTGVRLGDNQKPTPRLPLTSPDGESIVSEIMEILKANCQSPSLNQLPCHEVLLASQFGSSLYNVSVKSSDTDYMIVFCENASKFVAKDFVPMKSLIECRGPAMNIEFTAYEVSKVAECLLKGSVNLLELVFINPDDLQWAGQAWRYLHEHARSQFLSEMAISQFMGYAKTHLKRLENGSRRQVNNPGKLLYHIRHKLNSVRSMMANQVPAIRLYGERREWIMAARDITDIQLAIQLGQEELKAVQCLMKSRQEFFRQNVDPKFLQTWLGLVRGWPSVLK